MQNNFVKPTSLDEALKVLNTGKTKIIAGGTDVCVLMHEGKKFEGTIVDICAISELKGIRKDGDTIVIGAGCTHTEISTNEIVKKYLPILAKGCSLVGSTLIRNRGTVGGNIANNGNCADSIPPLFILDATVVVKSVDGERKLSLNEFFCERGKLALKENELIVALEIKPLEGYKWELFKVGRRKSLAISRLTLAIAVKENNGVVEDLRIIPGAMLPNYRRLTQTETEFKGKKLTPENIEAIADKATEEAIGMSGRRWSTEYKEPVLRGLVMRTLEELMQK